MLNIGTIFCDSGDFNYTVIDKPYFDYTKLAESPCGKFTKIVIKCMGSQKYIAASKM